MIDSRLLKELLPLIDNNNAAKEYYLTDIVKLAKEKDVMIKAVFVDEDEFMGINDKFELSIAENFMQKLKILDATGCDFSFTAKHFYRCRC